ncbi:MAG: undecaprenyldiphospho-muramoylpentapeptide beta-N-acetylglucosaminyltransferase [Calditrichaeota bacterium]|nr:undecaprenyldiphospho-muramoylpentapeptide beta-N-acetylglucosaminyltransferase [Calditrichota bacterium]
MSERAKSGNPVVFLFAGGGTGGHLYPALAIAQKLEKTVKECEIHFVGTKKGIENRVVPEYGYPLHLISVRGVTRKLTPANIVVPFCVLWSLLQCGRILFKIRPAAVVGTGGYVSGPVLFMASLLGYPTLVQEQNSYPGVTTRLLAKRVKKVHLSFKESLKYFKKQSNLIISGNPVRDLSIRLSKKEARQHFNLETEKPTLLVFGGSQGAVAINHAVLDSLEMLMHETDVQIIWSTGKTGFQEVKERIKKYSYRIWVSNYIDEMEVAYAASDLVISRAGAMTLAEITMCRLPSILIPYPYAAAGHQVANARSLEKSGAAVVIVEKDLEGYVLAKEISRLLDDSNTLKQMQQAAENAAFPNATTEIVQSVLEIAKFQN